jgi:hypothetical protein
MPHVNGSGMRRTSRYSQGNSRPSEIRNVRPPALELPSYEKKQLTSSECVSKFELHKIYDTQLTPEQADELALAEAVVRAFVTWDISPESVDVTLQVRDMLDKAELEVQEALEERSDEVVDEGQSQDQGRVIEDDELDGGSQTAEMEGNDKDVDSGSDSGQEHVQRTSNMGRALMAGINNESDEEEEQ